MQGERALPAPGPGGHGADEEEPREGAEGLRSHQGDTQYVESKDATSSRFFIHSVLPLPVQFRKGIKDKGDGPNV